MKRLAALLAPIAIALTASSALAQQTPQTPPGPGPMWGYGHMWGGGWGWHAGAVLGPFILLLALVGVVALILWLVRWQLHGGHHQWYGHGGCPRCGQGYCPHCGKGGARSALDILEERFARGEIDKAEFEERRKLLDRK